MDQIRNQINTLIKIAKISDEEKKTILAKLVSLNEDQLNRMKRNLMQQVAVDIFFDSLEELEKDDRLLDEAAVTEIENKIIAKFEETQQLILTESELSEIRQNLQTMQQKVASTAVKTQPQAAQQAPVQTPMAPKSVALPTPPAV